MNKWIFMVAANKKRMPDGLLSYTKYKHLSKDLKKLRRYKFWKKQAGLCGICNELVDYKKEAVIDHNHKTDIIRGLLCKGCNAVVGQYENNDSDFYRTSIGFYYIMDDTKRKEAIENRRNATKIWVQNNGLRDEELVKLKDKRDDVISKMYAEYIKKQVIIKNIIQNIAVLKLLEYFNFDPPTPDFVEEFKLKKRIYENVGIQLDIFQDFFQQNQSLGFPYSFYNIIIRENPSYVLLKQTVSEGFFASDFRQVYGMLKHTYKSPIPKLNSKNEITRELYIRMKKQYNLLSDLKDRMVKHEFNLIKTGLFNQTEIYALKELKNNNISDKTL